MNSLLVIRKMLKTINRFVKEFINIHGSVIKKILFKMNTIESIYNELNKTNNHNKC